MIMERYLNIFARIPPLPIYYDILDAIRWSVYLTGDEFEEYEFYDSIIQGLTSWRKSTYDAHSIQKAIRELTDLFTELGWIERKLNKLKIKERREIIDFFNFLKDNFKRSITRLVAWAVWYIYNRKGSNFKLSELPQILPEDFDEEYIIKILKRLRVEIYDKNVSLNELALQKIIKTLEGKVAYYWPVFSVLYVKGTKFFKILGGQSCRTYVDVPNFIYEDLISKIAEIDHKSTTSEEFFAATSKVIQYYNEMVLSEYAREAIGTSIDWLSYKLEREVHLEKKDYGLRMRIKWKRFLEFLEEYAQSDVELWKKYRYITSCKILATDLARRQQYDFESVTKRVKMIAEKDMDHIKKLLDELADIIEIAKNNLIRFEKAIYRKYKDYIPSLTRIYLLEMKSEVKAAKSFVDHGIPSMWYRNARTIIENLAWSIFEDLLCFKTLRTGYLFERCYFDINIGWVRKACKQPSNIRNVKDKIRKDFLRGIKTIKHEKELKDLITEEILRSMSYPLFIALFGKVPDKNEEIQTPIVHRDYTIKLAQESLRIILGKLNVENMVIEELTKKLESLVQEEKIVPPLHTHRFVLEFVDNALSTNFYKLWDSYSFFVHSNFASWHIISFTSVLEFKILKNELMKLLEEVNDAFNALVNVLKN